MQLFSTIIKPQRGLIIYQISYLVDPVVDFHRSSILICKEINAHHLYCDLHMMDIQNGKYIIEITKV